MSLDKETVRNLNMQCRRALKKPLQFVYCPEGADGDPVLIIDKNIKPQLNELKKTAKRKKFVVGRLTKRGKVLAFYPRAAPDKLSRDLKNTFAKKVPLLKTVAIVSPEEAKAERQAQGRESFELSDLAAQIGRRAAIFRKAPDKLSEARIGMILDDIERYRGEGGKTNFSGLEKELRAQLKARQQPEDEGEQNLFPGVEVDDDDVPFSHPFDDLSPEETEELNALADTISRRGDIFRKAPHKLSEDKLEMILDNIDDYQDLYGSKDTPFTDLRRDVKARLNRERHVERVMSDKKKAFKWLSKRLPEAHKKQKLLDADQKAQEEYYAAWDAGIGDLQMNARLGSNAGVDLKSQAEGPLKGARDREAIIGATFEKMLDDLKWAKIAEEIGTAVGGKYFKVLKMIGDANDALSKIFDALTFYPLQKENLLKDLGDEEKLVIAWGADTAKQRAAFDAEIAAAYEKVKQSAVVVWNAKIPPPGFILQAVDVTMGLFMEQNYGKARDELINDAAEASADAWKYETHIEMGERLIAASNEVFLDTRPPRNKVHGRNARSFTRYINRTADYYDYAAEHHPDIIQKLGLPPVRRLPPVKRRR